MKRLVLTVAALLVAAGLSASSAAAPKSLEDLMMDMQIAPLDGQAPPPFSVTALDGGGRVRLADVTGKAVLLYFWATW